MQGVFGDDVIQVRKWSETQACGLRLWWCNWQRLVDAEKSWRSHSRVACETSIPETNHDIWPLYIQVEDNCDIAIQNISGAIIAQAKGGKIGRSNGALFILPTWQPQPGDGYQTATGGVDKALIFGDAAMKMSPRKLGLHEHVPLGKIFWVCINPS